MKRFVLASLLLVLIVSVPGLVRYFNRVDAVSEQDVRAFSMVQVFALGGLGIEGVESEGEVLLDRIFASPDAESIFLRVLKNGTPEAKAYALLGLHRLGSPWFAPRALHFKMESGGVCEGSGCTISSEAKPALVVRIEAGKYDGERG